MGCKVGKGDQMRVRILGLSERIQEINEVYRGKGFCIQLSLGDQTGVNQLLAGNEIQGKKFCRLYGLSDERTVHKILNRYDP